MLTNQRGTATDHIFVDCFVLQEMDNAPDLMDDTFLLAGRAAAYAPRMLLHETLLPLLLDTAMVSVSADLSLSRCLTDSFVLMSTLGTILVRCA